MEKEWYVVNTYSGHENKVKEKLEMRASTMGMEDYIFRVVVPEQTQVEVKDGVEKEKKSKMFPGYILVEMVMTDEAWFIVRNTPGVTGFIGSMVNTVFVMGSIYVLLAREYAQVKNVGVEAVLGLVMGTVTASGIPEAIAAAVLVAVIGKVLLKVVERV